MRLYSFSSSRRCFSFSAALARAFSSIFFDELVFLRLCLKARIVKLMSLLVFVAQIDIFLVLSFEYLSKNNI